MAHLPFIKNVPRREKSNPFMREEVNLLSKSLTGRQIFEVSEACSGPTCVVLYWGPIWCLFNQPLQASLVNNNLPFHYIIPKHIYYLSKQRPPLSVCNRTHLRFHAKVLKCTANILVVISAIDSLTRLARPAQLARFCRLFKMEKFDVHVLSPFDQN